MKSSCKLRSFIIPVFLLIGLLNGCNSDSEEKMTAHYQKGIAYAEDGNYSSAVIEFRNAVQIDPMFADARYQLGIAYMQTQQPGNALNELERAASLNPENTDALIKVAEIYALVGNLKESREALDKIFKVDQAFSDAYALLAQIELTEGNQSAANEAIDHALALNPNENRYTLIYSRVLSEAGKLEEAEAALKQAVRDDPSARNLKLLIAFYTNRGNGDAEEVILPLLEKSPDASQLHLDMASFFMRRGALEKAESYILAAIEENPQSPELKIHLGNFYRRFHMTDRAEKAFRDAAEIADDPVDANAFLADLYFSTHRYDQADELINSVLKKNTGHPHARLVKAKLLVRQQENSEALRILKKLTTDFPRLGEAYYQKGLAHLNTGEIRLSYTAANQALQYMPNHPDAKTLMAHHFMLQQNFDEAKKTALSALETMPGNLRAGIIYARSMLYLGETEDAIKLFENISAQVPDNIEVLFHKAEAYRAHDRNDDAIATLKEILTINSDFIPAMAAVTSTLVAQEEIDEAIAVLREQLRKTPENPHYLIILAELVNRWTASPAEALDLLEKARETAPDIPRIYTMTADIQAQQGKTGEAIENYKIATRKNPNDLRGYMVLGALFEQAGDKTSAMDAYSKALTYQPDFAPAANNLAWMIAKSETPDLSEALRLALVAKNAHPDDPYISDTLGYVHYKRGSYQLAITQFNQAILKRPDMSTFRHHLAKALFANGEMVQAKQELEKALAAETDFPEYEEAKKLLSEIENNI